MKGFISLGLTGYLAIGAAVAIGGSLIAVKVQTSRLESCKAEYASFKATVQALGEAAEKANREREASDKKLKEKVDADHKDAIARLNRDIKRVRDSTRSSPIPEAPASSKRPDLACFDRAELDRAVRAYEEGILGLLAEGATATIDLNAAKVWAQSLSQ